jgi:hypothetical protein
MLKGCLLIGRDNPLPRPGRLILDVYPKKRTNSPIGDRTDARAAFVTVAAVRTSIAKQAVGGLGCVACLIGLTFLAYEVSPCERLDATILSD